MYYVYFQSDNICLHPWIYPPFSAVYLLLLQLWVMRQNSCCAMQLKIAWIQQTSTAIKLQKARSCRVGRSKSLFQCPFALFMSELHLNLHSFWMTCFLSGHKLPSLRKILCNDSVPELLRLKGGVKVPWWCDDVRGASCGVCGSTGHAPAVVFTSMTDLPEAWNRPQVEDTALSSLVDTDAKSTFLIHKSP